MKLHCQSSGQSSGYQVAILVCTPWTGIRHIVNIYRREYIEFARFYIELRIQNHVIMERFKEFFNGY